MSSASSAAAIPLDPTRRSLVAVADALRDRSSELIEVGLAVMRNEVPDYFEVAERDPDFIRLFTLSFDATLDFVFEGLRTTPELNELEAPSIVIAEAEATADLGMSLEEMLMICRVTHRLLHEAVIDAAQERIQDPVDRAAALRSANTWLFSYFDWASALASKAYRRRRDAGLKTRERRLRQQVLEVLRGGLVDSGELGYDLAAAHVCIVAWGVLPERAITDLQKAADLQLLAPAGTGNVVWGWLGGREVVLPAAAAIAAQLPSGTQLALGEPGRGPGGFRRTHRQALDAYRVAQMTSNPVTGYEEVALISLVTRDVSAAREFVEMQIGPLAFDDSRSAVLRETLQGYFDAGQNATAAAARLGVNDRTVAYRIRSIEERLGVSVTEYRDELAMALKLLPVVGGPGVDRGVDPRQTLGTQFGQDWQI